MSENVIALIFSLCWLGAVTFVWCLMFFKGYAKKWGREIIQFQKNLGIYNKSYELMFHPIALKIIISFFLAVGFYTVYLAIILFLE